MTPATTSAPWTAPRSTACSARSSASRCGSRPCRASRSCRRTSPSTTSTGWPTGCPAPVATTSRNGSDRLRPVRGGARGRRRGRPTGRAGLTPDHAGLAGLAAGTGYVGHMAQLPPLTDEELAPLDAWWRANNYLTVGQIYLMANPLLREPLKAEHIKPRLLGHWGTSPGLGFIYTHVSRLIRHTGQQCLFITGPGHGGPSLVGASYEEGTYTDAFPHITEDAAGLLTFFRQFSAPGGIPSHVSVTTPGSIHEGGELGYALIHAFGAAFDNPDLLDDRGRRRRRGRDRPARGLVEGDLVPQPGPRRRRTAGPSPQRRQDRRPDRPRPQAARRGREALRGPRLRGAVGRGRRPSRHALPVRRGAGDGVRQDPGHPARRARRLGGRPAAPPGR